MAGENTYGQRNTKEARKNWRVSEINALVKKAHAIGVEKEWIRTAIHLSSGEEAVSLLKKLIAEKTR